MEWNGAVQPLAQVWPASPPAAAAAASWAGAGGGLLALFLATLHTGVLEAWPRRWPCGRQQQRPVSGLRYQPGL